MKNLVAIKIVKRYCFDDINRNIKSIKWVSNKKVLNNIKKVHFDLKKIYNEGIL